MENPIDDLSVGTDNKKQLSVQAADLLYGASPWIRAVAIIGLLLSLYQVGSNIYKIQELSSFMTGSVAGMLYGGVVVGVLGFVSGYFLLMYGIRLRQFGMDNKPEQMKDAFVKQRIYFTWVGVLTIISIVAVIIFIFWAYSQANAMRMRRF